MRSVVVVVLFQAILSLRPILRIFSNEALKFYSARSEALQAHLD